MMKRSPLTPPVVGILLCLLLVLTAACTPAPTSTTAARGSTNAPAGQRAQTSCPANGTARAAVMRPLAPGHDQGLVYIYNEVPEHTSNTIGHLRRYDVTRGQKSEIVSSGIRIDQAQVSADGQWVLFLSIPDPRGDNQHSALLQLVRLDGQGLQTLYCFPTATYSGQNTSRLPISLQWSVNQQAILFSVNTNNDTSLVQVLHVANGAVQTLFVDHNDQLYYYSVVAWLDSTHFYLIKQGSQAPTPPATVFLVDARTATVTNPGLVQIFTTPTRQSSFSLDSSYDATQLFTSSCLLAGSPFSTTLAVGPALGGARHTIFQEQPADCIQTLRAILPATLLLLVQVYNATTHGFSHQVWSMSLPGGSMRTLATLSTAPGDQTGYTLNETSQFPWSNLARNGNAYALHTANPATSVQSILIGPLAGGPASSIATTNPGKSAVSIAGWTTL